MKAAREYIAGTGASGALIASAVVAFLLLAAFLAFEGFPVAGNEADSESVTLTTNGDEPAAAAAVTLAGAPGAVAGAPAGPGGPEAGATAGPGAAGTAAGGPGGGDLPSAGPGPDAPPDGDVPVPPAAPPAGSENPLDTAVAGVDETVDSATGIDPNLGETVGPATDQLDQTLEDTTGRDLGGHLDGLRDQLPDVGANAPGAVGDALP